MLLCIFEDDTVLHLQPFTRTRAAYMLRTGHRTLLEGIRDAFPATGVVLHCRPAMAEVVREQTELPVNHLPEGVDVLFVNGRLVDPDGTASASIRQATNGTEPVAFISGDALAAAWCPAGTGASIIRETTITVRSVPDRATHVNVKAALIDRLWQMLSWIQPSINADFDRLSKGYNVFERPGTDLSDHAVLINGERVYAAPGASIRSGSVLDASAGPIILDRDAVVFENTVLRGPVSIGAHSLVKVGSIIESSTIGPWCKVAGEVHGSIIQGYSNKAHPGYLGDSILGSWCNLGAATNSSNLRNDYAHVTLYNEALGESEDTGQMFAGLFMGDHSKCGINTMFNTGTVIGVCCNLYGAGYQPRYVPSFTWGGPGDRFTTYRLPRALQVARAVTARRDRSITAADEALLERIFAETEEARANLHRG